MTSSGSATRAGLSEDALIATAIACCPTPPAPAGPGDDCAVLPAAARVVTTDVLIEGTHFLRAHPPEDLGWKALAVNLSDVAAMGATPEGFLLSVAAPRDLPAAYWEALCRGLGACARAAGAVLVGGDTVASTGPLCLTVTAWGLAPPSPLLRSGARPGDLLLATGPFGRSGLGLERWLAAVSPALPWQAPLPPELLADPAVRWHLRPEPPLRAGPLALATGAHAAMDLSDGLATDLPRLARASVVELVVDLDALPADPAASADPARRAALGEDYGLLVAAPPVAAAALTRHGLVALGHVRECGAAGPGVVWRLGGRTLDALTPAFSHFGEVGP